ncbi:uncharacterized protein CPUR_03038 [Claviceps purpurea 20.1]|uniref:Uncharacterized protein n=1 Tax=Claviceps purpurea (strain 20.1) TaxID=1111077 RepID=M1W4J8_CLAP2|nr:uncharacterized protein CPUR_03038 [Claviceps purpurea 20.1]
MSSSYNDFRMAELIERGRHLVEAKKYNRALNLFFRASSFNNGKCDNVHHIEALDSRAAAFEAMGELDSAADDAEWILQLAPQLPDGYLRLGNTEKLQGNSDFAWEIYTMGIEAVKETSMEFSPKLQVRWRNPRSTTLRGIMTRPRDSGARKIVIPEDMNLTQSMLTLLLDESPYLEYLKIEDLPGEISFPTNGKTWNRLKHFSLEAGNYGCFFEGLVDDPGGFPCSFLQDAAGSLEHLDFVGIPAEWYIKIRCGPCGRPDTDILSAGDDLLPDFDFVQDTESKNLRSFKTTSLSILPDRARNLLSKALQTKQLTSFDIVFPKYYKRRSRLYSSVDKYVEGRHADHLRGYDWARGAPSIQSLSCYGLRLHPPPKNDQDHLVADFLATFPNLRILSIACEFDDMADYVSLLVEILRHTHLETMYMRRVDHEACAQLRQAARDQGVQLKKLPGRFAFHWPPQREWPVSLGPGRVGG